MTEKVDMPQSAWRARLDPERYRILREMGTERPCTGRYHDTKPPGRCRCAGCGQELFSSETKFDCGTGWPGFTQPVRPSAVREEADRSFGMVRTEVMCARVTVTCATCSTMFPRRPGRAALLHQLRPARVAGGRTAGSGRGWVDGRRLGFLRSAGGAHGGSAGARVLRQA
jgi:peptide-methionine (R)-S-oxide reductase